MQAPMRTPGRHTPGRRANANKENLFFEPGKFGRKTGLTLRDTGERDEYGFEHVSGIYSSPAMSLVPPPAAKGAELRRTPRMPPPRTQTPRRTNIGGSPVRNSTIKASARKRVEEDVTPVRLRDHEDVVQSIEREPEQTELPSSVIAQAKKSRKSIFDISATPVNKSNVASSPPPGDIDEISRILDTSDTQQLHDSGLGDAPAFDQSLGDVSISQASGSSGSKRKRSSRTSNVSRQNDESIVADVHSSTKRRVSGRKSLVEPSPSVRRTSLRHSEVALPSPPEEISAVYTEPEAAPQFDDGSELFVPAEPSTVDLVQETDNESEEQEEEEEEDAVQEDGELSVIEEDESQSTQPKKRGRRSVMPPASRRQKAKSTQRAPRAKITRIATLETEAEGDYGTVMGNIRLRSATPFEDTDVKVTRSGRASIKPLQHWKNERYVVVQGEIQGVIRAKEVTPVKRKLPTVRRHKHRAANDAADEPQTHEDLLPEAWEEELGIIEHMVKAYDPATRNASMDEEVFKPVGFAARAIVAEEKPDATFRFAKVLTETFFGAGVLELPPGGRKPPKNCRQNAMAFFVHEGKVAVDVAGVKFGVAKGGMWHVPRGNIYSVENESEVFPAKVFYSQGCEAVAE